MDTDQQSAPSIVRFGVFEVDLRSGELRRGGVKLKLQEQPFRVLEMLVERPAEVVTREELQKRLWSESTFFDFGHGVTRKGLIRFWPRDARPKTKGPGKRECRPGRD